MNMNKRNYSKELDQIVEKERSKGNVPTLLLQACCAPCSSACLERLRKDFYVTVFYYNPNIEDEVEYQKRKAEEIRLIGIFNSQNDNAHRIEILDCDHEASKYAEAVKGLEDCPEGGDRCTVCYALRLEKTAEAAAAHGFDYFTTTLTISPLKDADRLNTIGEAMGQKYNVAFLPSDFKKKDGYLRSIQLSKEYGLYRQNYCGCQYSRRERDMVQ